VAVVVVVVAAFAVSTQALTAACLLSWAVLTAVLRASFAVVRIGDKGVWMPSKPCENCERCMRRKGVKKVFYSIAEGEYGVLIL
jgi:deoxycytidylate deaminase